MKKLMETFYGKLEDSEVKQIFHGTEMNADDEGTHQHQGIQILQDNLSFDFIIEECFKNREEFPGVKAIYQQFRISDGDFD
jgi:hypothetical protein